MYLLVNLDEYTKLYTELKHYKKYLWAKNLTKKEWAEPGKYDKELRETIVNRMPMGAIILGSSGRITMSNPAAERNLEFNQCILDAVYDKTTVNNASVDFFVHDECHKLRLNTGFVEEEDANIGVLILMYEM